MSPAALALAASALALAVLTWPDAPLRRLGRARHGHVPGRLPAWWPILLVAALPVAGAHVALASAIAARTGLGIHRHIQARAATDRGQAELARAAETLAGALRAGQPAAVALAIAGSDAGGEVGAAIGAAAGRARLGGSVSDALTDAGLPVLAGLTAAWRVAETRGIPLADIAEGVRADAVGRRAHRSRAAASLAGPRTTMLILAVLPLAGIGMGQLLGAAPLAFLGGGGLGGLTLIAGVACTAAGVAWSLRILADAEEAR